MPVRVLLGEPEGFTGSFHGFDYYANKLAGRYTWMVHGWGRERTCFGSVESAEEAASHIEETIKGWRSELRELLGAVL